MKFSIDFNPQIGRLSGWAASARGEALNHPIVTLSQFGKDIITLPFGVFRDDVKNQGIHPDGYCGFVFELTEHGIKSGDIFRIIISALNEKPVGKTFIAGNKKIYLKDFQELEYPRDDFSIMEPDTAKLLHENSNLIFLKKLIIRLRRAKRAKGWRLQFSGVNYSYQADDFSLFQKLCTVARYAIFDNLSIRFIWSIIDTFADFFDDEKCYAWFALSNLLASERMAQTLYCIGDFKNFDHPINDRQINYWGMMATNHLGRDDSFDVFLTRSITCLQQYPLAYAYYRHVMLSMMEERNSIWGVNVVNSEYFSEAWSSYKSKFLDENLKEKTLLDSIELN